MCAENLNQIDVAAGEIRRKHQKEYGKVLKELVGQLRAAKNTVSEIDRICAAAVADGKDLGLGKIAQGMSKVNLEPLGRPGIYSLLGSLIAEVVSYGKRNGLDID